MNGIDALVFIEGIGENSAMLREKVCKNLDFFGKCINKYKNRSSERGIREIQNGYTKILVIPINEELEIAIQSYELLEV